MGKNNQSVEIEEFDALSDAMQIMYLKNLLIVAEEDELKNMCSTPEDYAWFIDTLNIALSAEPAFFLLDEKFLRKAETSLYNKRFEYHRLEGYNDVINEIIGKLNELHNLSDYNKAVKARDYIAWNLDVRKLPVNLSVVDLYRTLAFDAFVLDATMDSDIPEIDTSFFIASTNYITEVAPDYYETYPQAKEVTLDFLEKESKKRGFWNRYERKAAHEATQQIQKIKTKEE